MATELLEVKFRLYDGTDIGPSQYALSTTIANLKEIIFSEWPREKEVQPTTVNDLKLINAGKVLGNNLTLAESRVPIGETLGGVVTMHVVVQPATADTEEHPSETPTQSKCTCAIL